MTGIKNFVSLCWQDVINLIHIVPPQKGNKEILDYSKQLRKQGVIRIPQYISTSLADSLRGEIESWSQQVPRSKELKNGARFNYRSQDDPAGPDAGMLDIYFVENIVPRIADIDQKRLIEIIKNATGQEIIPLRVNAYLNRGIKNTRMYHIDNTQPVIYKAFIYLSDVPDVSYGPYSFVRRTHRFSFYTYLNLFSNLFSTKHHSTDMPIYSKGKVMNAIGLKGDLFLSNQNGIHRGLPQEGSNKRIALIFSFMVKSRLSYIHESAKVDIVKSKASSNSK